MQPIEGLVSIGSRKKSGSASFCVPTAMLFDTTICEIKSKPAQESRGSSRNSTPSWPSVQKKRMLTICSLGKAVTSNREPSSITSTTATIDVGRSKADPKSAAHPEGSEGSGSPGSETLPLRFPQGFGSCAQHDHAVP